MLSVIKIKVLALLEDLRGRMLEWLHSFDKEDGMLEIFIQDHSDRRIRQETMDFFRNRTEKDVVVTATLPGGELVGVTACNEESQFSFTVVHREYRKKGIATALVALKKDILTSRGKHFTSWVAKDNIASTKVMRKIGLIEVDNEKRRRAAGEYIAVKYAPIAQR